MPPKNETFDQEPPTVPDHLQALIHLSTATTNRVDTISHQLATQAANMTNQTAATTQTESATSTILANHHLNQGPPPPPPPPPLSPPPPPHQQPRPPKMSLPNFNGDNPLDWIFQANNYFEYYSIPPAQRVTLSVFYFTGDALSWYKHLATNHLLGTCPEFSRSIELRFGPSTYENNQASLFKLRQTTSVSAYQTEFEKLCNCVSGLDNATLLNCFLFGLRSDIQNEIALHHPSSLHKHTG